MPAAGLAYEPPLDSAAEQALAPVSSAPPPSNHLLHSRARYPPVGHDPPPPGRGRHAEPLAPGALGSARAPRHVRFTSATGVIPMILAGGTWRLPSPAQPWLPDPGPGGER